MQNLDIPFPDLDYKIMCKFKGFNLIYPYDHPLCQAIRIDMVVRALSFDDAEYTDLMQNEISPKDVEPIAAKLFEVAYIRECRVSGVAKFEWNNNYGPSSAREFLNLAKLSDHNSFVKVINLKTPTYSLKEFNKTYGI